MSLFVKTVKRSLVSGFVFYLFCYNIQGEVLYLYFESSSEGSSSAQRLARISHGCPVSPVYSWCQFDFYQRSLHL